MPVRQILRLTPWPARRRILGLVERRLLRRIPVPRRLAIGRRIVPIAPRLPATPAATGTTVRARAGRRRTTASADRTASPAGVRRANLNRVVAALGAAGLDWFRVPSRSITHTAVAVPENQRDRAIAALASLTASGDGGRLVPVPRRSGIRDAEVLCAWRPVADPLGSLLLGTEFGCEVEFWRESGGCLVGPRGNPVADVVPAGAPEVVAPERAFGGFAPAADTTGWRTREVFTMVSPDRVMFPVDVVYTWVDGDDPAWRGRKARALRDNPWIGGVSRHTANPSRFTSRDELRYSLRALHCFAPWVNRIFLVTDDQLPSWLDTDHPGITVVGHREIFGSTGRLPTFNSHAIESRLHRIAGLSEHFLYLNDDVFLGRPVVPELFFTSGGLARFFPSRALVDSAPPRPCDAPVNAAGKNNRRLVQETFGRVLTRKMMHTPHPARRSVLAEIEERFPAEIAATAAHQFRHPDDVSLLSSLQQYYGYLTGRAVPGEIAYLYADLADASAPFKLARLLHNRNLDAFCLNDTDADAGAAAVQAELLADFLPAYFPFASPYELATPRSRVVVGRQVPRTLVTTAREAHRR